MQTMNEAMNMSLDDYIALNKSKIKNNNNDEAKNTNINAFKARSRNVKDEKNSDDDNDDIVMDSPKKVQISKNADKVWKAPDSNIDFLEFDYMVDDFNTVYNECLEESSTQNMPPANSQQWRIDPININRPAGMAPLIPRNVAKPQRSFNNRQQNKNNNRNRNYNNQKHRNNNNFNRQQNRNFATANRNIGNVSRNQVQLNAVSKLYQNFRQNNGTNGGINNNGIDHMASNNNFNTGTNMNNSHDNHTLIRTNQMDSNLGKLSLASIFNIDNNVVAQGNLGSLAGKFIEFFNNYENTVHKPVYDMDIQQEIAKLQNKKIVCTNSGTIVSTDGTGVPDCKIVPKTTDMTLNIRYC